MLLVCCSQCFVPGKAVVITNACKYCPLFPRGAKKAGFLVVCVGLGRFILNQVQSCVTRGSK